MYNNHGMKKIIFSFDDALLDFYTNVFPILKKYGVKATLNVITGFSDKTVPSDYRCCSIEQLKEMSDYGIEIANHSDDHVFPEPLEGYDLAQKKLQKWFPDIQVCGVATPFTQQVPTGFFEWCIDNGIKYVRLGDCAPTRKIQRFIIKSQLISHRRIYCINNSHYSKKNKVKVIYSFPIMANKSADEYKSIIELCSFNPRVTLMFHSLVKSGDKCNECQYPEGAWTINKFEELVEWILKKGYKICRQCDTI